MDDATADQVCELVTKGATGLALILATENCRKTFDELVAEGVEITREPTEYFYGIDCGIRDPFGSNLRITQPAANAVVPDAETLAREFSRS